MISEPDYLYKLCDLSVPGVETNVDTQEVNDLAGDGAFASILSDMSGELDVLLASPDTFP